MATKLLTPSNLKAVKLTVSGLDEYATKIAKAGRSIDDAAAEAVNEIKEGVYYDILPWAEKHYFTGATFKSLNASDIKRNGNYIYAEVGIDSDIEYLSWHAVFAEYGTPNQAADPGIRMAFAKWERKSGSIFKRVFAKWGVSSG